MSIQVADNFSYSGKKFFDGRMGYATLSDMKAVSESTVPNGILAYVDETDKYYTYNSTNDIDPTTGKWRELQTGGVVPNPSGTATTELSQLQIDSVIYSIVTKAVDDLTNYYTKTNIYTKTEVDTIASNIKNSRFEVVSSLPTTNIKTNVIYLVPKSTAQTNNVKDEYINLDGTTTGWELIGSTDIDLSGYVTTTALNTALADYMTTSAFNTAIANYYTKTEVNAITGDLNNLTTTAKTNLVAAINEAADPMPAADMSEVVSPLPSVYARLPKYSTEEQVVATWIDGKPVYQKVIQIPLVNAGNATAYVTGASSSALRIIDCITTISDDNHTDAYYFARSYWYKNNSSFVDGNSHTRIAVNGQIIITCTDDWRGYTATCIVKYTKTTD